MALIPDTSKVFRSKYSTATDDGPAEDEFAFATVEKSIEKRLRDERFRDMKPIERDLYRKPAGQPDYSHDELESIWKTLGELKVYTVNEESQNKKIVAPFLTFEDAFGDNRDLMNEIKKNKFEKPSPIQSQMWPVLLSGRDCVGISQTGSGKTLAFLLPAFLHIERQMKLYSANEKHPRPFVLALTPTRELAQQIEREVEKYSYNGYRSVCLYGGAPRGQQMDMCKDGVEIVIATPGRLADLAEAGVINLPSVSYVVLDEADRMLDMGFEPSIRRIMYEIRPDRIVALTSATWPDTVRKLVNSYTKDAVMTVVGSLDLTACENVSQYIEVIEQDQKIDRVVEIVNYLNETHGSNYKMIIFVKSKVLADHLSSDFCLKGIRSQGLHGGRSQEDRETSLADLRSGRVQILIATDLASRGIDVPDLTHVVNFDFPGDIEEYVHRVGRTGRAGRKGDAMTFMCWSDRCHVNELISILEKSKQDVPDDLIRLQKRYEGWKERNPDKLRPRGGFRNRRRDDENNFQTSY